MHELPTNTGFAWSFSSLSRSPVVRLQVEPGKSVFTVSSLKSRKSAGMRTTHSSPTFSQDPEPPSTHWNPGSTLQSLEQPSPSRRFPSSQSSPRTMPSPQVEVHGCPLTQVGSASQRSLQPSKGTLLPSSQLSAPSILPSPQTVFVHLLGEPSHLCPRSMR